MVRSFKSSMPSKNENSTMLKESQVDIEEQLSKITAQLSAVVGQLERQADSTFSGKSWGAMSLPGFANRLVTHGKALVDLSERLKSGALPQWKKDQNEAHEKFAMGRDRELENKLDSDALREQFNTTTF